EIIPAIATKTVDRALIDENARRKRHRDIGTVTNKGTSQAVEGRIHQLQAFKLQFLHGKESISAEIAAVFHNRVQHADGIYLMRIRRATVAAEKAVAHIAHYTIVYFNGSEIRCFRVGIQSHQVQEIKTAGASRQSIDSITEQMYTDTFFLQGVSFRVQLCVGRITAERIGCITL